ncbi:MAG: hypothetical protein C5B53_05640 [Candidatus Melainabacteria bacterium]|nr:MAG: hypothetical protein C5B53_05640 [Candidatus Melainabacteria bacterium]
MVSNSRLAHLFSGVALLQLVWCQAGGAASQRDSNIAQPRLVPATRLNPFQPGSLLEPKNVPDFPKVQSGPTTGLQSGTGSSTGSALRGEAASTTLPLETRLKLVLETAVDSSRSKPGDIFEAHVRDDLFLGANLVLPRGSLIRGRVADVAKPKLISRAAHIGLKLDEIVTPLGEVIPLDAALEFRKGLTNKRGQLDPGTSFGTRVDKSIKAVTGQTSTGATKDVLVAANIATLGAPAIATAIGSSAIALFSSGDKVQLSPGQELEILLTQDLGLQIN